jgi:hypothetical protein
MNVYFDSFTDFLYSLGQETRSDIGNEAPVMKLLVCFPGGNDRLRGAHLGGKVIA